MLLRSLRKYRVWLLAVVCAATLCVAMYKISRPPPEKQLDLSLSPNTDALSMLPEPRVTVAVIQSTPEDRGTTSTTSVQQTVQEVAKISPKLDMAVGILSALRTPPTVLNVANGLTQGVNHSHYALLVWQAFSASHDYQTRDSLENLGFTVFTQSTLYPELDEGHLQITLGDTKERMLWRAGHVLDYANLLEKSLQYNAEYVVILEDDMMPAHRALDKVYESLKSLGTRVSNLGYMAFFSVAPFRSKGMERINGNLGYEGACVLAFPAMVVPKVISHLRANVYTQPVDLLIASFMEKMLRLDVYERTPHLFQHNSRKSSYRAADQSKRDTEHLRSIFFVYDETNTSLIYHPSRGDGYVGCYMDSSSFSDLSGKFQTVSNGDSAVSECKGICNPYLYFGLQRSDEGKVVCYCGNEFGFHNKASENDCGLCGSNGRCGNALRNAVYRSAPFTATLLGCFKDSVQSRDLEVSLSSGHTTFTCAEQCSKHKFFGMQFGGECFCSNTYGRYGKTEDNLCLTPCARDMKLPCGGPLANLIFQNTNRQ